MRRFPGHWFRKLLHGDAPRRRPSTVRPTVTELETRLVPALTADLLSRGTLALVTAPAATAAPAPAVSRVQSNQVLQAIPANPVPSVLPPAGATSSTSPHAAAADLYFTQAAECDNPDGSVLQVTAQDVSDAVANQEFTETVAFVYDSDPNVTADDLSATVDWGDGQVDQGVQVQGPEDNGNFWVAGTHTYGSDGQYGITVTVDDNVNGTEATDTSTATVAPEPSLSVTAQDVSATAGQPFTQTVAVVSDPGAWAGDLSATVDWGDGQVDPGVPVQGPDGNGNFWVDDGHTYGDPGQYGITVTVDDPNTGLEATDTTTANVAAASSASLSVSAQPVSATAGQPFTPTVAVVSDPGASSGDLSATIDWGDGQVDQGVPLQGPAGNGNFAVVGTHTYAGAGQYPIQVTVADNQTGEQAQDATTAYVQPATDNPLTVTGQNIAPHAGETFTGVVALGQEPGASGNLTATVNWGDASTTDTLSLSPDANGNFAVQGTHTYQGTGIYTVSITVDDASTGAEATTYAVATVLPAEPAGPVLRGPVVLVPGGRVHSGPGSVSDPTEPGVPTGAAFGTPTAGTPAADAAQPADDGYHPVLGLDQLYVPPGWQPAHHHAAQHASAQRSHHRPHRRRR